VWQSTMFAVIGLVGSFLLRRRPARASQVLFLAMVAAVLVPAMSVPVKHFELGLFTEEPILLPSVVKDIPTEASVFSASSEPQTEDYEGVTDLELIEAGSGGAGIPWRPIVLYGWMIIILILLGRLFAAFFSGVCLLRRAQSQGCEQIQRAADCARARLGITKDLQVRSSKDVRSPVIWCWRPIPVLLVPGDLDDRVDWEGVISHELAHWRRWDHISGLIAELIVCVLCWNPLLWWSKKRMVRLSEQACDDWVLAGGRPCEDYAQSLLNFKPQKQAAFVPAVVHSKRGLADRVRRILQDSCGNPRTGVAWALAVSLVAVCLTTGLAFAQTRPAKPEAVAEQRGEVTELLIKAAIDGNIEQVKSLLSKGADIDVHNEAGDTPLHIAVKKGHMQLVRFLIDQGAAIDAKNNVQKTPLDIAVLKPPRMKIVELLVEKGAAISTIHAAAFVGYLEKIRSFMEGGTDIGTKGEDGQTPLFKAVYGGHVDAVRFLLDNGANVNEKDKEGNTSLHYAVWFHRNEIAKLLIDRGADVQVIGSFGFTPLHWAAMVSNKEMAELLLAKGADVDARAENEKSNFTPLDFAIDKFSPAIGRLLVERGAAVSSIHAAAFVGDLAKVKSFLENGVGVGEKFYGVTALHTASAGGNKEVVELLLAKGADINALRRGQGHTPLHWAVKAGHKDIVELLINKGADVNKQMPLFYTSPLHIAAGAGFKDIAELLIDRGADANAKNRESWTPLHYACWKNHRETVKVLLAKGTILDAREEEGKTPLTFAKEEGYTEIVELLLKHGAKE